MSAEEPEPSKAHRDGLARILRLGLEARENWKIEELAAVLQYQLSAPLQFDLSGFSPTRARQLHDLSAAQGLLLRNLDELFRHPVPPLELLQMVKDFAKSCLSAVDAPMPKEVAGVLYYMSIAVALVRRRERISDLSDAEVKKGFDWAVSQPWLEASIVSLLKQGRDCLQHE